MGPWDKVQSLLHHVGEMRPNQREFVLDLYNRLDPNNAYEELTEKKFRWLDWLYRKYELGEESPEW